MVPGWTHTSWCSSCKNSSSATYGASEPTHSPIKSQARHNHYTYKQSQITNRCICWQLYLYKEKKRTLWINSRHIISNINWKILLSSPTTHNICWFLWAPMLIQIKQYKMHTIIYNIQYSSISATTTKILQLASTLCNTLDGSTPIIEINTWSAIRIKKYLMKEAMEKHVNIILAHHTMDM